MSELSEITIREHDPVAGIKRTSLFPSSAKRLIDTATSNIVYIGIAAAGSATSAAKSWFLEKVDTSVANTITITHATDSWDNRATATYT